MTDQELLIAEMTIGDGYLNDKSLYILHSESQKEYLEWKKNLLEENGIACGKIRFKNNNNFPAYYFTTRSHEWIRNLKSLIYTPKKTFSKDILKHFTALGLAIWYFDDGGLAVQKRNGKVHSNELMINTGLSRDENQVYIDYFKEYWGINFSQVKNHNKYRLRCGTKEARKFINIIKEYTPPCMQYKIAIKDPHIYAK